MPDRDDESAEVRWFFETIAALRAQMSDEEFYALRSWIEFLAEKQTVAH